MAFPGFFGWRGVFSESRKARSTRKTLKRHPHEHLLQRITHNSARRSVPAVFSVYSAHSVILSEPGFAGLPDFQINGMNAFWHSPGLGYGALDCHSKVNINAYQKNIDAAIPGNAKMAFIPLIW